MSSGSYKRAGGFAVSTQATVMFIAALTLIVGGIFAYAVAYHPGGVSMQPAIEQGDYVLVSRLSYVWSRPKRGDVVVYRALHEGRSRPYLSRIVGMPGERIQMRDSVIHLNGKAISRKPRVTPGATALTARFDDNRFVERFPDGTVVETYDYDQEDDTPVYEVPPGRYFMIGDNRNNSYDSRSAGVGSVPGEAIVGRVSYIAYSWSKSRVGKRVR